MRRDLVARGYSGVKYLADNHLELKNFAGAEHSVRAQLVGGEAGKR